MGFKMLRFIIIFLLPHTEGWAIHSFSRVQEYRKPYYIKSRLADIFAFIFVAIGQKIDQSIISRVDAMWLQFLKECQK